jgi:hypothetical protein
MARLSKGIAILLFFSIYSKKSNCSKGPFGEEEENDEDNEDDKEEDRDVATRAGVCVIWFVF